MDKAYALADSWGHPPKDPYDGALWVITAGFMLLFAVMGAWHSAAEAILRAGGVLR